LVAIALLFLGGLCLGPINAESIVGMWFYRRARRKAETELPLRQAEARKELEKVQRDERARFDARRAEEAERENDRERIQAIRNFMR
jgi:hypothetical protein